MDISELKFDEVTDDEEEENGAEKQHSIHLTKILPKTKLQNGLINEHFKSQNKSITAADAGKIKRYQAMIRRKIELLKCNPMELIYGEKMEMYQETIVEIIFTAAKQKGIIHFDQDWFDNQINLITNDENEHEDLCFIGNYILKLAQTAVYDEQLESKSYQLTASRLRKIRVYELARIQEKLEKNRKFPGKFKWTPPVKKEEIKSFPSSINDKFLLKNENDDMVDLFAKSTSPPPQSSAEVDIMMNDDIKMDEEEEDVLPPRYHPIDRDLYYPKHDQPKQLTSRQALRERIAGHISIVPENDKNDAEIPHGTNRKKQTNKKIKNKLYQPATKKARIRLQQINIVDDYSSEESQYCENIQSSSSHQIVRSYQSNENEKKRKIAEQLRIVIKSCLKKASFKNNKEKKKVQFSKSKDKIDNEGKSQNNPDYRDQHKHTKVIQTTTQFTLTLKRLNSRENLQEDRANYKFIPSSDFPIEIKLRENPNLDRRFEPSKIQKEIYKELLEHIKYSNLQERPTSRLFIMDSILTQLNKGIFKNMRCFELNFPRMPEWLIDMLEKWWTDNLKLNEKIQQSFKFSKIFILIGLDLNVFYADPEAKENEIVYKFLVELNNWFDGKIRKMQNSSVSHLKNKPDFVVITIPEVGDWRAFFREFNEKLRKFVAENSSNFTLLDWASQLQDMDESKVKTAEQRTAILIKQMYSEHAVFYR